MFSGAWLVLRTLWPSFEYYAFASACELSCSIISCVDLLQHNGRGGIWNKLVCPHLAAVNDDGDEGSNRGTSYCNCLHHTSRNITSCTSHGA